MAFASFTHLMAQEQFVAAHLHSSLLPSSKGLDSKDIARAFAIPNLECYASKAACIVKDKCDYFFSEGRQSTGGNLLVENTIAHQHLSSLQLSRLCSPCARK